MSSHHKKRVIIDTDGGVDDAIALILALCSPEYLMVEAITTVSGNVHVDLATENMARVMELMKKVGTTNIFPKIYKGESSPINRQLHTATAVHGEDGLGGSTLLQEKDNTLKYPKPNLADYLDSSVDGVDALLSIVKKYPKEITIITLGPMTNIARAIQKDKDTFALTKEIVIMGGAFARYGNVTTSAEYNIYVDPESVDIALQLGHEIDITFVPLNVTEMVWFENSMIAKWMETSLYAQFIHDISQHVMTFKGNIGEEYGMHMHDPLAVAAAMDQTLLNIIPEKDTKYRRRTRVFVECKGTHTTGETVGELRLHQLTSTKAKTILKPELLNANVCVDVNPQKFYDFFFSKLFGQ
mmetsp:Transcript_27061/g.38126  ORF Transcript_27061/g.38126 Transcript_27061/m.38126 type:complete len:355 (-) Transcript_27061:60-1124(-)